MFLIKQGLFSLWFITNVMYAKSVINSGKGWLSGRDRVVVLEQGEAGLNIAKLSILWIFFFFVSNLNDGGSSIKVKISYKYTRELGFCFFFRLRPLECVVQVVKLIECWCCKGGREKSNRQSILIWEQYIRSILQP